MLDKLILMQCKNCKIIWLIMTDKDIISIPDGHSFSSDPLLSIIIINYLLSSTNYHHQANINYLSLWTICETS